ncbi:MAG: hypothetical protein AAF253_05210 [Pseudomonadota bacterium]
MSKELETSIYDAPSLVVTTTADIVDSSDGVTSLREAVFAAEGMGYHPYEKGIDGEGPLVLETGSPDAPVITFAEELAGETVELDSPLFISSSLTIDGDIEGVGGDRDVTISATGSSSAFVISGGYGGYFGPTVASSSTEGGEESVSTLEIGLGYGPYGPTSIDVTLNGLTITGAGIADPGEDGEFGPGYGASAIRFDGGFGYYSEGGPVLRSSAIGPYGPSTSELTISNSLITGNADPGTGTVNLGYGTTTTIINTTIDSNSSNVGYYGEAGSGGAIHNSGYLTVANSTISNHYSSGEYGGRYYAREISDPDSGGYGSYSPGYHSYTAYTASALFNTGVAQVVNTTIANNTSTAGVIGNSGILGILSSTITGNAVTGAGSSYYGSEGGYDIRSISSGYDGPGDYGPGYYGPGEYSERGDIGVIVNISGYSIYGPRRVSDVETIGYEGSYGPVPYGGLGITNTVIADNSVTGLYGPGPVPLGLSIASEGEEDDASSVVEPGIIVGAPFLDGGGNLIVESGDPDLFEAYDLDGRPLLADNGGPVATVAIGEDGAAADGGTDETLTPETFIGFGTDINGDGVITEGPLPVDARGEWRDVGDAPDIGAFEIQAAYDAPPVEGSEERDVVNGGGDDDQIRGGEGDDKISGGGGEDGIDGGADDDRIAGQGGADDLRGGAGEDQISGGSGDDSIDGGDGDDFVNGGVGNDEVSGGTGDDDVRGADGDDTLNGGDGDDTLRGGKGDDTLNGDAGEDRLLGAEGDDTMDGGDGDDTLSGSNGDDTLFGGDGEDGLVGGKDNDRLDGGDGDDSLNGGDGFDILIGGDGNDTLRGGDDDDLLFGDGGDDQLSGQDGDDVLIASGDTDMASGGDGDDILLALEGDHVLVGGAGDDTFVFTSGSDGDHKVRDFKTGDALQLAGFDLGAEAGEAFEQVGKDTVFSDGDVTVTFKRANVDDILSALTETDPLDVPAPFTEDDSMANPFAELGDDWRDTFSFDEDDFIT